MCKCHIYGSRTMLKLRQPDGELDRFTSLARCDWPIRIMSAPWSGPRASTLLLNLTFNFSFQAVQCYHHYLRQISGLVFTTHKI